MDIDVFTGISTLSLTKPMKPIQMVAPDATTLSLHDGEDAGQYQSFINAISDLAQAFKFLPADEQQGYQTGLGLAYSNLNYSPDASDWNLLTGADTDSSSVLNEINSYFDWDAIKSIGSGQSYFQIAGSGALNTYSDEQAFDLMCSMTDSKERVFDVLKDIFGDQSNLSDNSAVIENISNWLAQYTNVDPHNLGALKMFFGMQSDFIDMLDAYMNSQTYWGSDNTFSDMLTSKAEAYIATLSGDKQTAAESLGADWLTPPPQYDMVGDTPVSDLATTDGSWVQFFNNQMSAFSSKEVMRAVLDNLMTINNTNQYNAQESVYEEKKDDLIQDELYLQKMQQKAKAESQRFLQKLLVRSRTAAISIKRKPRSAPIKAKGSSKAAVKPVVRPVAKAVMGASIGVAAKRHAVIGALTMAVAPKAPSVYAKKKDEKKVI